MNRKKTSKLQQAHKRAINHLAPLNDPLAWLQGNIPCPWSDQQIADYQKQLDSAFGAENAIVLVWSYDRRYWDQFYDDWHATGLPKGKLAKKPILLFKQVEVNDGKDHLFISTPRFLLLERLHGSQLQDSWEDSAWVSDPAMLGGQKRIRAESPPKDFYQVLRTIAEHEIPTLIGDEPPCCKRMWQADRSICYGKYRPPSDIDLAHVRSIRRRMDRDGLVQRNDATRSKKIIENASIATKHFMQQAARRKASAVKELILGDPQGYMGAVFERYNIDLSAREIDTTLRTALEQAEEKRFEETIC